MFIGKTFFQVIFYFFLIGTFIKGHELNTDEILSSGREEKKLKSDLKKFAEIVFTVDKHYADPVNVERIIIRAIQRMLTFLDPFSTFHNKDFFQSFKTLQSGTYSGIGANLIEVEEERMVHSTTSGSPAAESGLNPGDIIFAIDDKEIRGYSSTKIKGLLHGERGSEVRISVKKLGVRKPLKLTIVRDLVPEPSILMCFNLRPQIVYLKLLTFTDNTEIEFDEYLAPYLIGLEGLILDLRNNLGGSLKAGIQIADRLLNANDLIMTTKGNTSDHTTKYVSKINVQRSKFPIIVLINKNTASSAEIIAAAIKENDRGVIVGENSFGKGLIQTVFPLKTGYALFLTTGKWFTPLGQNLHGDYKKRLTNNIFIFSKDNNNGAEILVSPFHSKLCVARKGGITPDIYVEPKKLSGFQSNLLSRRLFFSFSRKIWFQYRKIAETGNINSVLLSEFHDFLEEKEINFSRREFKKHVSYIKHQLKSNLLLMSGQIDESNKVLVEIDPYVVQAIKSLKQAKLILSNN